MKKVIIFALLIALVPTTAHTEETGALVRVDTNGNAISTAIVCTQSVCGTGTWKQDGWVLQAPASADGNVAGVGAGQASIVKIDLNTGVWTIGGISKIKDPISDEIKEVLAIEQFTSSTAPWVTRIQPTQSALIAQQEATIANLYAQLEKVKKFKKVKKAKK